MTHFVIDALNIVVDKFCIRWWLRHLIVLTISNSWSHLDCIGFFSAIRLCLHLKKTNKIHSVNMWSDWMNQNLLDRIGLIFLLFHYLLYPVQSIVVCDNRISWTQDFSISSKNIQTLYPNAHQLKGILMMVKMITTSIYRRFQLHRNKCVGPRLISLNYVQLEKKWFLKLIKYFGCLVIGFECISDNFGRRRGVSTKKHSSCKNAR